MSSPVRARPADEAALADAQQHAGGPGVYPKKSSRFFSRWVQRNSRSMLGPLFWGWFRARTHEQREWLYPTGSPEVTVAGADPVRILVIGDGAAAGCGVRTHQLGIAGYLARHVAGHLRRGVVVTVVAEPTASARSTLKCLAGLDLAGYDAIVLMLATTDAFCLTPRTSWRRDMTTLVGAVRSSSAASVFVTGAASMHLARSLSPFARSLTGSHARMLTIETRRLCARTDTPMISLDAASDLTSLAYARWGRRIGMRIVSAVLESASSGGGRNARAGARVRVSER